MEALPGDVFPHLVQHLGARDLASLRSACAAYRAAVDAAAPLWETMHRRHFPADARAAAAPDGVGVGAWRERFLATHVAAQQLRTRGANAPPRYTDSDHVGVAQIHDCGASAPCVLTAQGHMAELRVAGGGGASHQFFGHSGRVLAAATLRLPGGGAGVVTGSTDRTVRLWSVPAALLDGGEEDNAAERAPVAAVTPRRTLRAANEAITALQLLTSASGVTVAAAGSRDSTIRCLGLAPLLPSPSGAQPLLATFRGHGGEVTALAPVGGRLASASLDGRVKLWDVWEGRSSAGAAATVKVHWPLRQLLAADPESAALGGCAFALGDGGAALADLRQRRLASIIDSCLNRYINFRCMALCGWDLAVGDDQGGINLFDARALAGAGRSTPYEALMLPGDTSCVSGVALALDRHKLVAAGGERGGLLRVWPREGGAVGEPFDLSPPAPPDPEPGVPPHAGAHWNRYRVTSLAVRGPLVAAGLGDGGVWVRDFRAGVLPPDGGRDGGGARSLAGKFWAGASLASDD